jgi:hypothetical protein
MAGKLSKFQKQSFEHWKGTSKLNHLGGIFQLQPQKATNLMVQLLAWYKGKTLDTFLSQFPTKEFDSDDEYTWDVIGSALRNIPLVEARTVDGAAIPEGTTVLGANGEPFYLVFAEDWFADGEVIVGELNEIYPLRVLGNGRNEGTNTVYKVELMGGITAGMPVEELAAGKRFSVEYAPVEREFSRKVGDIRFASPVAMRNEFTTIRIQHKVSGAMLNKKVAFGIPVTRETNGRYVKDTVNMWMHEVQWQLEQQWNDYKNNVLAFGRSNRNRNGEYLNIGKSGEVIRMGAGLYEQMEVSNTLPYNTFSLKLIEDALYELSAAKLGFNERTFVIKTGERGAIQFHKAVLDTVSGWAAFQLQGDGVNLVRKANSPLHENALSAGFQFVEFQAPNGVKVKIDVDPYYDDPVRNKIMHPNGGPAFSYRYDIFDIGTMDQPNIFKVAVKGQNGDYTSYEWGLRNPFTGQMGNPYMSHDEDSATIHKMTTTGVCVLDPTRTMSLIPAILVG